MKKISILFIFAVLSSTLLISQNNAIYLDGSGDYLSVPESELWAFESNDFTISFWITISDVNRVHDGLIGRDDYQWLAMEYNHDGDHRLNLWIDSNGSSGWNLNNLKPDKNDWDADTWYNIAIVRDGNTVKILIDGEESISTGYSQTIYNPSGVPLYFGRSQLPSRTHHGQIDEIRIWNYALTDAEFVEVMNSPLNGNELGLIGYWDFNESTGSTAFDSSPFGNDCTLWEDAAFVESTSPVNQIADNPPFSPVEPTGLPYTIILSDVIIDEVPPMINSQIGVFDGDLCVGFILYSGESNLQLVAWQGDDAQGLEGFTPGNPMAFRIRTTWYDELNIFDASTEFIQGDGNFGYGTFSVVNLEANTGLVPDIAVSSESLNFQMVEINTSSTQTVVISNTGNTNLTVNNISSSLSNFTVSPASMYLEPGFEDTLSVTFTPTENLDYNEQITIISNALSGIIVIDVHGAGLPIPVPSILVTPGSLNFGNVSIGSESQLYLNLNNLGSGDLNVTTVSSSNPVFSVIGEIPVTLQQNENVDLLITFSSSTEGQQTGYINITSNDEQVNVTVIGYAGENHFQSVPPTGLPYNLIIEQVDIQGFPIDLGDEIAVFEDTLCVGVTNIGTAENSAALMLDGSGDYVNLGNPPFLQITGNQTIEMWINPANLNNRQNPFAKAYAGEGTITLETNGTLNYFYGTGGGNNSPYQGFTMTSPIPVNEWTHIAIVRDLDNMTLTWYKNGGLMNQTGASYPYAAAGSNTAYIGRGYVNDFHGMLDEVRIWNISRTQEEIQMSISNNISLVSVGLIGFWSFNQLNAFDQSFYGNHGTLYGNAQFSFAGISSIPANIHLIAWQRDDELGLDGFTSGADISFKIWTNIYQTDVELDANTSFLIGDGTFGDGQFSVVTLDADSGLEPDIYVDEDNLYLGQLEVGQSTQGTLTVHNFGNAPLHVNFMENSEPFSISTNTTDILPGDSLDVIITFSPTVPGNQVGLLQIMSDDPDTTELTVSLEGFALPIGSPDMGLSTSSLSFNGVIVDSTVTLSFNVINIGTAPLIVSNISTDQTAFSADPTNFTLWNTNDNQEVTVSYTPTIKGLFTGTITVTSNGGTDVIFADGVGYDGHFESVQPTGLPYSIIVEDTNINEFLEIGDEIAVFDGELCVGTSPVIPGGGSLLLNGGGYIEVPDDSSLDLEGNQLTLESWVYIQSYAGDYREIIGKIGWSNSSSWGYNMHINDGGGLHFNFVNTSGTSYPINSPNPIGNNEWHHVAAIYSGTLIRLYVDGEEVASMSALGDIRQSTYSVRIGAWWGSDPNYFNGMLDELRVWNYARSQDQIQSAMLTELSGTELGLMGYWKFDRNGIDSSVHENHGSVNGNIAYDAGYGNSSIQLIAWQADPSMSLPGFQPDDEMTFRGWTTLNEFPSELDAPVEYLVGNGEFGFGQFSVATLSFDLPDISVFPVDFFFALSTPDYTESQKVLLLK